MEAQAVPTLSVLEMFHTSVKKQHGLKAVDSEMPNNDAFFLFDLSLKEKGVQEDKRYADDPWVRSNLRRGNTIICELAPLKNPKTKLPPERLYQYSKTEAFDIVDSQWARRGLYKFFDLCIEYSQQSNTQNLDSSGSFVGNYGFKFTGQNDYKNNLRAVIFLDVERAILSGQHVSIYKMNKANGENAQVSYYKKIDVWMVASKNVCLALKNRGDINFYKGMRFDYAKRIANAWFDILGNISADKVRDMKVAMAGKTLVGEYVGHPDLQHLVRYDRETITFYAISDHTTTETCIPVISGFNFFKRFGLDYVKCENVGSYNNLTQFYIFLEELFRQMSSESIEEGEEGSVVYFTSAPEPTNAAAENAFLQVGTPANNDMENLALSQKVLTLSKLKTLEYRIFRKLREKLKTHALSEQKGERSNKFQQFKKEVQDLTEGFPLPRGIQWYHTIAKLAFDEVADSPGKFTGDRFRGHYIDFLDKIRNVVPAPASAQIIKPVAPPPSSLPHPEAATVQRYTRPVILIAPPNVLSSEDIAKIQTELGVGQVKTTWKEMEADSEMLTVIDNMPRLSNKFNKQNYIIFIGFTSEGHQKSGIVGNKPPFNKIDGFVNFLRSRFRENYTMCETLDPSEAIKIIQDKIEVKQVEVPQYEEEVKIAPGRSAPQASKPAPPAAIQPAVSAPAASRVLVVVIPIGIPGMGKSFFVKDLEAECAARGYTVDTISSDGIRESYINKNIKKYRNRDEAFQKTHKPARDEFFRKLSQLTHAEAKSRHVIFLDKNHPPNAIDQTVEAARSHSPDTEVRVVGLIPNSQEPLAIGRDEYPFSLSFLVQCLMRVKDREQHETLTGPLEKRLSVVFMMFKMYKGIADLDSYLSKRGFDFIMRFSFTDEKATLPDNRMRTAIPRVVSDMQPNSMPTSQQIQPVLDIFESLNTPFPIPNSQGEIASQLNQILPADEETKTEVAPAPVVKSVPKGPGGFLFYGIDFTQNLSGGIVTMLKSALHYFVGEFRGHGKVAKDSVAFLSYMGTFAADAAFAGNWKFPADLHLTTKFFGGKGGTLPIDEAETYIWKLTHLYYIPERILCASAENIGAPVDVENANPHVTLALNKWPARCSNDTIKACQNTDEAVFTQKVTVNREKHQMYVLRLSPAWLVKGQHKGYSS